MANLNNAFGARAVRHRNGAAYNGSARLYYSTGATALFIGDPVIVTSAGGNAAAYFGSPVGSLPTVARATAGTGNALTGFVVGFFVEDRGNAPYGVNGASRGVFVADDPDLIFEIQDSGVATLGVSAVSASTNLDLSTNAGSTATGRSGATLNTTLGNVAGDQLKILGLAERPNNVIGQFSVWEVMINNHTQMQGVAGI